MAWMNMRTCQSCWLGLGRGRNLDRKDDLRDIPSPIPCRRTSPILHKEYIIKSMRARHQSIAVSPHCEHYLIK